jgi:L-asparagine oxygenase
MTTTIADAASGNIQAGERDALPVFGQITEPSSKKVPDLTAKSGGRANSHATRMQDPSTTYLDVGDRASPCRQLQHCVVGDGCVAFADATVAEASAANCTAGHGSTDSTSNEDDTSVAIEDSRRPASSFAVFFLVQSGLTDFIRHRLHVYAPNPYTDFPNALRRANDVGQYFPKCLRDKIIDFGTSREGPSVLIIRGFLVSDTIGDTPDDGGAPKEKAHFVEEGFLLAATSLLGVPIGSSSEKKGRPLNTVAPVKTAETSLSNAGSKKTLGFHTELCHLGKAMPDFLGLFCLRADRTGEATTDVVDVRDIIPLLPEPVLTVLRQERYIVKQPESCVTASSAPGWSNPTSVILGSNNNPEMVFEAQDIIGLDEEACAALVVFKGAMERAPRISIKLMPGDLVLIDNRRAVHARTFFTPFYDGKDRWLVRCNVRRDVRSLPAYDDAKKLVIDTTGIGNPSLAHIEARLRSVPTAKLIFTKDELYLASTNFNLARVCSLPPVHLEVQLGAWFAIEIARGRFASASFLCDAERIKFAATFFADRLLDAVPTSKWDAHVLGGAIADSTITTRRLIALIDG